MTNDQPKRTKAGRRGRPKDRPSDHALYDAIVATWLLPDGPDHGTARSKVDLYEDFALHNQVLKALQAAYPVEVRPKVYLCKHPMCQRFQVPGYDYCHWHGTSRDDDETILETVIKQVRRNLNG